MTKTHTCAHLCDTFAHSVCATPCAPHTTPLHGVWGVVCAVAAEVRTNPHAHTEAHTSRIAE